MDLPPRLQARVFWLMFVLGAATMLGTIVAAIRLHLIP